MIRDPRADVVQAARADLDRRVALMTECHAEAGFQPNPARARAALGPLLDRGDPGPVWLPAADLAAPATHPRGST
jgi:hypothetical protein